MREHISTRACTHTHVYTHPHTRTHTHLFAHMYPAPWPVHSHSIFVFLYAWCKQKSIQQNCQSRRWYQRNLFTTTLLKWILYFPLILSELLKGQAQVYYFAIFHQLIFNSWMHTLDYLWPHLPPILHLYFNIICSILSLSSEQFTNAN